MAFGILCTATAEICFAKWAIVGAGDTGQSIDGGGHEGCLKMAVAEHVSAILLLVARAGDDNL